LEVLMGDQVLILDELVGGHVVAAMPSLGTRWPAHATSTGKVLLAYLPEADLSAWLGRRLDAWTARTIVEPGTLVRELARVRARLRHLRGGAGARLRGGRGPGALRRRCRGGSDQRRGAQEPPFAGHGPGHCAPPAAGGRPDLRTAGLAPAARTERPGMSTTMSTKTQPARYYTDPDWFERELGSIHYQMWLYAGRSERIRAPGDYFLSERGGASVLILRDQAGEIRAFHNVCRHRGTLLCTEAEGQLPGRIRCRYHAWTYRLDGTLSSAPHMDDLDGFALAD